MFSKESRGPKIGTKVAQAHEHIVRLKANEQYERVSMTEGRGVSPMILQLK
jgi:hypothetical protein